VLDDKSHEADGMTNQGRPREIGAFAAGLAHIVAVVIFVLVAPTGRELFDGMSTGNMMENLLEVSCDSMTPNVNIAALLAFVFLLFPGLLALFAIQAALPFIPLQSALASIAVIAISAALFAFYGSLASNKRGCAIAFILVLVHSGLALFVAFIFGFLVATMCAG